MVLKVFILKGLGKTNTSEEEYDRKIVPHGKKWTVREVLPYFSRKVTGVYARIYLVTTAMGEYNGAVLSDIKEKRVLDFEAPAGEPIRLCGWTDGVATDFVFEITVDEATV